MPAYFFKKCNFLVSPIVKQFPFFVVSMGLFGLEALQNIHGLLVTHSNVATWTELLSRIIATFFISYLLTVIVNCIKKTWFKFLAYLFVLFVWSVYMFLRENFGLQISPSIMILLAETTGQETQEFFKSFILTNNGAWLFTRLVLICLASLALEWAYRQKARPHIISFLERTTGKLVSVFICLCILGGAISFGRCCIFLTQCNSTDDFIHIDSYNWFPIDPLSRLLYSFYGVHVMNNELITAEGLMEKLVNSDVELNNTDSLNIVLIIGESYIKAHCYLYGYSLNTTPFLQLEKDNGNLFVFNNVVTPFNITTLAMKNALCANCVAENESWNSKPFFPAIFKKAGYDVYMWDNQKTWGEGTSFVMSLNSFLYGSVINKTYTDVNNEIYDYDEGLITSFDADKMTNKHNLIIFHLMGQHVDVDERYPHNSLFTHFTKDSINRSESYMTDDKRKLIASYDNATLYNDYVIKLIIEKFRKSQSIVVYFSDHGDEIYDFRDSKGRVKDNMSRQSVKYQYEVPFIVWCSDEFMNKNPNIVRDIREAVDRPFMTDNVCQLLFHIAGIKTEYYRSKYDPIHHDFSPSVRLLEHVYDYDSIMSNTLKE